MKTYRIQMYANGVCIRDFNKNLENVYEELVIRAIRNKALITKIKNGKKGWELLYPTWQDIERHVLIFELGES